MSKFQKLLTASGTYGIAAFAGDDQKKRSDAFKASLPALAHTEKEFDKILSKTGAKTAKRTVEMARFAFTSPTDYLDAYQEAISSLTDDAKARWEYYTLEAIELGMTAEEAAKYASSIVEPLIKTRREAIEQSFGGKSTMQDATGVAHMKAIVK